MAFTRAGLLALAVKVAACAPDAVTAPSPVQKPLIASAPPISPEMRLRDILGGRVTGVKMMSAAERGAGVRVRFGSCASTIPLERRPLFVLDGIPLSQGGLEAAGLNPTNIMEIQILKGPIAVRTYGPSARNGAVLIRTRR